MTTNPKATGSWPQVGGLAAEWRYSSREGHAEITKITKITATTITTESGRRYSSTITDVTGGLRQMGERQYSLMRPDEPRVVAVIARRRLGKLRTELDIACRDFHGDTGAVLAKLTEIDGLTASARTAITVLTNPRETTT